MAMTSVARIALTLNRRRGKPFRAQGTRHCLRYTAHVQSSLEELAFRAARVGAGDSVLVVGGTLASAHPAAQRRRTHVSARVSHRAVQRVEPLVLRGHPGQGLRVVRAAAHSLLDPGQALHPGRRLPPLPDANAPDALAIVAHASIPRSMAGSAGLLSSRSRRAARRTTPTSASPTTCACSPSIHWIWCSDSCHRW